MNAEAIDDLIQSVLEGDASPSDVSRLEQLIATDAFVRERHARLKQAFDALAEGTALEDPPAGLRENVLAEIRRQQSAAQARSTPRPVSRPAFSWLRLALPVAAVTVAAVVVLWNGRANGPSPALESTSGAIAAAPSNTIAIGQGERAVSIAWRELPGGRFALDLVGAGAGPVTVSLAPQRVRLDRPADAIALEPHATDTILGEISGQEPSVRVTLTWPDGRTESRDIPLDQIRH